MQSPDLTCYGALADLVPLVGTFDARSPAETTGWYQREWEALAAALGFSEPYHAALRFVRSTHGDHRAVQAAGVEAFGRWLASQPAATTDAHARVQQAVIRQVVARADPWRVIVDPTTVEGGACYPGADGRMLRAFYQDTAPGYFGDGWSGPSPSAESMCRWETPLVLHLGTFPWVYSSRLDAGPGLLWRGPTVRAGMDAMGVVAALLDPAGNLRQDARVVAAIFQHFTATTRPLVEALPIHSAGAPAGLYRRGSFLYAHGRDPAAVGLRGPRGFVSALAYNTILRRFAAFVAVRASVMPALHALDLHRLAQASPDPCLQGAATGGSRA